MIRFQKAKAVFGYLPLSAFVHTVDDMALKTIHSSIMLREHHEITLLKLRQQVGLTQRELAEALGVTQKTISIWERGKMQPKLSFWQTKLIMEKLNCTLDQLIIATELKHQNDNEIKSPSMIPHNPRFF